MNNVALAFGLTIFAGLSTGIGGFIAFFAKRANYRFLSVSTGFSAGVMLYVSFVEIMPKGTEALVEVYGAKAGNWINAASFFGGMLLIGIIDNLIPAAKNPHELPTAGEMAPLLKPSSSGHQDGGARSESLSGAHSGSVSPHSPQLMRMGTFTTLAIVIHNFPEGLVTFLATLHDPGLGIAIAVAIAIHNIPEGIAVSVPIYYATGSRAKAFICSFLSGLAEPVGALIAYLVMIMFMNGDNGEIPAQFMGYMFGGVAGIMVYISLDELLPASRAYGKGHDSLLGLMFGMLVMALSLLLMQ